MYFNKYQTQRDRREQSAAGTQPRRSPGRGWGCRKQQRVYCCSLRCCTGTRSASGAGAERDGQRASPSGSRVPGAAPGGAWRGGRCGARAGPAGQLRPGPRIHRIQRLHRSIAPSDPSLHRSIGRAGTEPAKGARRALPGRRREGRGGRGGKGRLVPAAAAPLDLAASSGRGALRGMGLGEAPGAACSLSGCGSPRAAQGS